jgi:hypothetical protein
MPQEIIVKPDFTEVIRRGYESISYFAKAILEVDLHEEQEKALDLCRLTDEFSLTAGNRWGKGDLAMIVGSWVAAYKPVAPGFKKKQISILNTSISQDQANIVFDKFNERLLDKPKFSWQIKDIKKSPFPHIIFRTDITWWFRNASLNGKYLEGRSYLWTNFDEADLQDEFNSFLDDVLAPRLWDFNGMLMWMTTPRRGKRNAYKRWDLLQKKHKLDPAKFAYFQGDSRKNKFLPKSTIDKMNSLPVRLLNKNVRGVYDDTVGSISEEMCSFAQMLSTGLRDSPEVGIRYLNVWDFARSSTYNVGVTIELGSTMQLRSWERTQENKGSRTRDYWQIIANKVKLRQLRYKGITLIDATGIGDVIDSFLNSNDIIPVKLNASNEEAIIESGQSALQAGEIGLPLDVINQTLNGEYWSLKDELMDFEPEHRDKIIWDFVCALFIGIWYAKGHYISGVKKANNAPQIVPLLKGINKYAMATR